MNQSIDAFRRLSWRQRAMAFTAAMALVIVKLGLVTLGYGRTRRVLGTLSPITSDNLAKTDNRLQLIPEMSWAMAGVSHYAPFDTTCLERTLALWWMLRFRGVDSDIRIGTARSEAGIVAHAWLERDDVVINDDADAVGRYTAFEGLK